MEYGSNSYVLLKLLLLSKNPNCGFGASEIQTRTGSTAAQKPWNQSLVIYLVLCYLSVTAQTVVSWQITTVQTLLYNHSEQVTDISFTDNISNQSWLTDKLQSRPFRSFRHSQNSLIQSDLLRVNVEVTHCTDIIGAGYFQNKSSVYELWCFDFHRLNYE